MSEKGHFKGVLSKVQISKFRLGLAAAVAVTGVFLSACGGSGTTPSTGGDPNEVAAKVNGKDIKLEEVEKGIKAQAQGAEANLSPLELASARLQVLEQLIQTEVMFQRAEKEQTVPTEEEVTAEMNKRRTASNLSAEEFQKQMTAAGETEESWRQNVRKEVALSKLQEKITGKVEAPKDSEIEAFFNGNREQFKNKRGAQLAAIVIDPANSGQGDTTTNDQEAQLRAKEVGQRALSGADFATLAREFSEDFDTRARGGDWRYFTEQEMQQVFGQGVAAFVMGQMQNGQIIPQAIPLDGRYLIIKLQRKVEKDEDRTLESPEVRPQITQLLINARKNLLWQSYMAIALNEARIENLLARKVVDNPNELSGARKAPAATPADANTNTANANTNTASNANAAANAPANAANSAPANAANANSANANAGK